MPNDQWLRGKEEMCRSPVSRILSIPSPRGVKLYDHLSYPTEVRHLPCRMVQLIPGDSKRAGTLPLLCLAPRGVYRASSVALGAVGSYPTFSPLPPFAEASGGTAPFLANRACPS